MGGGVTRGLGGDFAWGWELNIFIGGLKFPLSCSQTFESSAFFARIAFAAVIP